MLTHGTRSQSDLLNAFGDPHGTVEHSGEELRAELGPGYDGDRFWTEEDAAAAAQRGPMAAEVRVPGGAHMVYIEPISGGKFLVRDPSDFGSVYTVDLKWVKDYVSYGAWKK